MVEVSSSLRSLQPYSNIGVIVVTWPDGTRSRGTASIVGRNDILTAGHVVYSPEHGGWATAYQFSFGADYNGVTNAYDDVGLRPTFTRWDVLAWSSGIYVDSSNDTMLYSETQYDVALIGIDSPIGDTLGWLELGEGYEGTQSAVAVGYPAGSAGMMSETVSVEASPTWGIYRSNSLVMGPGSSGGPLLVGNSVIGVKSTWTTWADVDFVWGELTARLASNDALIAPDATAPTVVAWSPDDGVVDAAPGTDIVVTFSEAIRRGSGSIVLKTGAGVVVERFDAATSDRLSISAATLTIDPTAELRLGTVYVVEFPAGSIADGSGNGYAGTASYSFRTIGAPTAGNDALTGTAGPDIIDGLAGDDTIVGAAGEDTLHGGSGDDVLTGGTGNDTVHGGDGTDIAAFIGQYRDYAVSSQYSIDSWVEGRFTLLGYAVSSPVEGQDFVGKDVEWLRFADGMAFVGAGRVRFVSPTMTGSSAGEVLHGTPGVDTMSGMGGDDRLSGGAGDDLLFGGTGVDSAVYASAYTDAKITAQLTSSLTRALAGYLVITPSDGSDLVAPDIERLVFADGTATLDGETVSFASSLPAMQGTPGPDVLDGTDGREAVYGGGGDDSIIASADNDHIFGGDGVDAVTYPSAASFFTVSRAADGSMTVSHETFGTDLLVGVERIRFTDTWYASDTAGSAGVAAKAVIATFGVAELPSYMAAGLSLADRGYTTADLSRLVADSRLVEAVVGNDSNAAFVERVFSNAVGRAPDAYEAGYYVGLLETHAASRMGLLQLAADAQSTVMLMQGATLDLLGIPYHPAIG